ncbi:MAG: tetratricopeptide repeat protein [Planctomycetota bacterium]
MNVIFAWIIENSGNTILITYIKECNYEKSIIFRHSVHTFWDRDKSSVLLQEGIYQEETLGNFEKAIDIYQQIIEADKSNRQSVAQALYRQGMCYLKKQDTSNARVSLKKLISKYPEQTDLIDKAMPVLRGLYDYDPATLMPADTLLYIEIGNPGQQIETILNMLKGTPFADPTALMRGPGMPQQDMPQGGMMGPAAFMNEGMMNEFKKVRGFAVGITEFSQNNPPLVMVLYPGESDALKGMITGS